VTVKGNEDLEVHLATCPECSADLARYRELITAMASLRDEVVDPPAGFSDRVSARLTRRDLRVRRELRRLAHDRRTHVAAASVGGALLGAGVIGFLWRRAARRPVGIAS
jgi:anti-sigma factor RsiW